jgi:hypothetical protein
MEVKQLLFHHPRLRLQTDRLNIQRQGGTIVLRLSREKQALVSKREREREAGSRFKKGEGERSRLSFQKGRGREKQALLQLEFQVDGGYGHVGAALARGSLAANWTGRQEAVEGPRRRRRRGGAPLQPKLAGQISTKCLRRWYEISRCRRRHGAEEVAALRELS